LFRSKISGFQKTRKKKRKKEWEKKKEKREQEHNLNGEHKPAVS